MTPRSREPRVTTRGLGAPRPKGGRGVGARRVPTRDAPGFSGDSRGASDAAGKAAVRREERELRRLVGCPLCGRSGGARSAGSEWCHRCAAELEPTPLQAWSQATGFRLEDLPALTGLVKRTVMRAARGQRVSAAAAAALARVTGISARAFTDEARRAG